MDWKVAVLNNGSIIASQYSLGQIMPENISKLFVCKAQPYGMKHGKLVDALDEPIECVELNATDFVDLPSVASVQQHEFKVGDRIVIQNLPQGLYVILHNGQEVAHVTCIGTLEFTPMIDGNYSILLVDIPCNELCITVAPKQSTILQI